VSQENVRILETLYEAINSRRLKTALKYLHPEVEIRLGLPAPDLPEPLHGHEGYTDWVKANDVAFLSLTVEMKEMIETDNQIVAVERWRAVGREGAEADAELTDVYTFHDGLVMRVDGFRSKAEALKAVGLEE
jgi:ketosteroid isomerase-like protein